MPPLEQFLVWLQLPWVQPVLLFLAVILVGVLSLIRGIRERGLWRARQKNFFASQRALEQVAGGYGRSWGSLHKPVIQPGAILVVNDAGQFKEATGQPGEVPVGMAVHSCAQLRPDEAYLINPPKPFEFVVDHPYREPVADNQQYTVNKIFNQVTPAPVDIVFARQYDLMIKWPQFDSRINNAD